MIYGGIQFLDPRRKGIAEINMATATSQHRSLGHGSREGRGTDVSTDRA